MRNDYRQIATNSPSLRERHLHALWQYQRYFSSLKTLCGKPVQVISQGTWNTGAGPDFLHAHLIIDGEDYRGSVEIHLEEEDWYAHGHHEDPNYNDVILHLSWGVSSKSSFAITRSSKEHCLRLDLSSSLKGSIDSILSQLVLDGLPHKTPTQMGTCAGALFSQLSTRDRQTLLEEAALSRLLQKAERLLILPSGEQVQFSHAFARGLAQSLGNPHNGLAFAELFDVLYAYRDLPEQELLASALGLCGFFQKRSSKKWSSSTRYIQLQELWEGKRHEFTHQCQVKLFRVRPLNHPIRRLVYLVKLLNDPFLDTLYLRLENLCLAQLSEGQDKRNLKSSFTALLQSLPHYTDSYWESHYLFESKKSPQKLSLLGEKISEGIFVNSFLPLLYLRLYKGRKQRELAHFLEFYRLFSAEKSKKASYLNHRFFGQLAQKPSTNCAIFEQGCYQIHHDYCQFYETSCEGCPFVRNYFLRKKVHNTTRTSYTHLSGVNNYD